MDNNRLPLPGIKVQLRYAERDDCHRLLELIEELAHYEKAPHEVTVTLAEFEEAGFGDNPVWTAIVAEVDNVVQGFALYYIRYSTWKGCRLYLEDFLVTEKYRGQGIGKILFEAVIREASKKGFKGMVWQVLDWNEPAINFYNKYAATLESEWLNASLSNDQIKAFIDKNPNLV
ncbi:GNAT family N-acetyltransferase [Desertivirga arenae]|uniref:GNAT family N-acetyltransferase n=1 Tax=Desertivirga arenae TaxID=2810309 RepID=UPI001F6190F2|nr:GNAT family N-acetyltransferase [Pedobacter sp. SYSU D00823]